MTGQTGVDLYPALGAVVTATVRGTVAAYLLDTEVSQAAESRQGVLLRVGGREVKLFDPDHQVDWEAVAPDQWPPRPGDIWRDGRGVEYFIYSDRVSAEANGRPATGADRSRAHRILARTADGQWLDWSDDHTVPEYMLQQMPGPWTLRYRKDHA